MSLSGPPNNPLFYAVILLVVQLIFHLTEVANAIRIPGLPGPPIIDRVVEIGIGNPITSGQYEIQFHPSLYDGLSGTTESGTPSNDLSYQVFMHVKPITSTPTLDYLNSDSKLRDYGSFLIADQVDSAWIVPKNCYYQVPIPPSSTTANTTSSHPEDVLTNPPIDQSITIRIDTTTSTCAHLYPTLTSPKFINNSTSNSSSSSSASEYASAHLQLGVAARNPFGFSTWHQRAIEINVTNTGTSNSGAKLLSASPEASNASPTSSNNTVNDTVPISIVLGVVIPMFVLMLLGGGMLYHRVQQLSKSTTPLSTSTSFTSTSRSTIDRVPNNNHNSSNNDDGLFIPNPALGEACSRATVGVVLPV